MLDKIFFDFIINLNGTESNKKLKDLSKLEVKKERIKKKNKRTSNDNEKIETLSNQISQAKKDLSELAEREFTTELPSLSEKARYLKKITHNSKFTNPKKVSNAMFTVDDAGCIDNGFLNSSNILDNLLDIYCSAGFLKTAKFLMLTMTDGKPVLEHLASNSTELRKKLCTNAFLRDQYNEVRSQFLKIKTEDGRNVSTNEATKQVYFPVGKDYHLLSVLTPSGVMFALKDRINHIWFSDEAKAAREARKKGQLDEQGFADIYDLTVIGFGGTKPQNISAKNSQYRGEAYLLPTMPPALQQQNIRLPQRDFFSNTLNPWHYKEAFQSFHKLISVDHNNVNIRTAIDNLIQFIVAQIIEKAWTLRQAEAGWSEDERYSKLPRYQKIWLDNAYTQEREDDDDWLDEIEKAMARWFLLSYRKVIKQPKGMGDDELPHIMRIINNNREGLR